VFFKVKKPIRCKFNRRLNALSSDLIIATEVYLEQQLPLYKVDRLVAKAWYKGQPIRDHIESDVKD
jgi:hypothetical protein